MDDYGTEDSEALNPVFNNDSDVDESWYDDGTKRQSNFGGAWAEAEASRRNSWLDAERQREAKSAGRAAENGATNPAAKQNAKELEKSPFENNVTGRRGNKRDGRKRKSAFRRFAPTAGIATILGIIVMLVGTSQWLFPFALVSNGLDQFNVLRTSMNRRSSVFMRLQMDSTRPYTGMGIFGNEKFKISKSLSKKFRKNGIIYSNNADGAGLRVLYFEDDDTGQKLAVVADEADLGRVPSSIQIPDKDGNMISVEVTQALTLKNAIDTNQNFDSQQNKSTRTIKGHIAGWFDSLSVAFHRKISNSRAKFVDTDKNAETDEIQADAKRGTLSTEVNDITPIDPGEEEGTGPYTEDTITVQKEVDGKTVETEETVRDVQKPPVTEDGRIPAGGADEGNTHRILQARAKKLIATTGDITDITCMVLKAFGAINMTIATLHIIQVLNYISGFLEAIDQAKAGEGGSVLNYYMGPEGWSKSGPTLDAYGNVIEGKEDSNAMLAKPTKAFFGGSPVVLEDKSVQKFNVEFAGKTAIETNGGGLGGESMDALASMGSTVAAYRACNAMNGAVAGVSLALEVLGMFVAPGASFAMKTAKELVKGIVKDAVFAAAVGAITTLITGVVVKSLANWLAMDLISNMTGEDPAYALSSGANMYMGRQMQQSSGLPGNREEVARQFRETQEVIAEEAEYERATRSPFDVTSKNTFLGSLAHQMIPIATTMRFSSLFSTMSQAANTVGSSVLALFPTVQAAGIESWFKLSSTTECPSLSVIGAVADAYCSPYFVSDYNTIEMDPAEVFLKICEDSFVKGCDANGEDVVDDEDREFAYTPEIKNGSDFSKWVVSCAMRESQYGFVDERVASFVLNTGNVAVDTVVNSGIGAVPGLGELVTVAQAIGNDGENLEWNTGQKCTSEDEKIRMFSRYSEDQRLLESEGLIEKSSVTAFMEKYYAENPLNNSLEGLIARYQGVSEEKATEMVDTMAYVYYIATYNPAERRQLNPEEPTKEPVPLEANETVAAAQYILVSDVVYADVRNRTWTV